MEQIAMTISRTAAQLKKEKNKDLLSNCSYYRRVAQVARCFTSFVSHVSPKRTKRTTYGTILRDSYVIFSPVRVNVRGFETLMTATMIKHLGPNMEAKPIVPCKFDMGTSPSIILATYEQLSSKVTKSSKPNTQKTISGLQTSQKLAKMKPNETKRKGSYSTQLASRKSSFSYSKN